MLLIVLALATAQDPSVANARTLAVPGSSAVARVWEEGGESWYSIEREGRAPVVRRADHRILLGEHPPAPEADSPLAGPVGVYLVQYETQPLRAYQDRVRDLGGEVVGYVAHHTNLVRMPDDARDRVAAEEFVRAVLPFGAERRLEPWLLDRIGTGELAGERPYDVWVFDREAGDPAVAAARIAELGGELRDFNPRSSLLGAMLTEEQLVALVHSDEVLRVARHSALEPDLDIVRQFSGADALELATGFTGQGVKGEVADQAVETTHPGFQHNGGVQLHGPMIGPTSHGTPVYGIVFGDGTGSPNLAGRGILPDGMGIFADGDSFGWLNTGNPTNRAQSAAELVDPLGPYRGTFQTSSLGSSRTTVYTVISANLDQIALDNDLVIVQALGNSGNPQSRPEAWGKNIVAVGGIYHFNTLDESDDAWNFGSSNGPAADGRIKPEFAHFYDLVLTAAAGGGYTSTFGGSSGSTPIVAGHFGLFFQMWHADVFHNSPTGVDPFESKPHRETAVAAMINSARPWDFSGKSHQLTRVNQGFGRPDVENLYARRDVTVFRDRVRIDNLEVRALPVEVAAGETRLKVTMVYRDPPGVPGATLARINDLSLRVIDPQGIDYHGNVGLLFGNESQTGGEPNERDTIENVWITNPPEGTWTVEVTAVDVNTDLYPGVPGNNADYALWITGATDGACSSSPVSYCTAGTSASGCRAALSASGTASASAPSGFDLIAADVEAGKNGLFFFGTSGRQANPWGNGTSFQCVVPPVSRGALLAGGGAPGTCEGSYTYDLNARWAAVPSQNPGAGATVQAQLWYRDPGNTSNQSTGLSDALELGVCP